MATRKSERLVNLVICLLAARRLITRQEIQASVEAYAGLSDSNFQRTFERDKDELRRLGVPIEVGPTDPWSDEADGYRIRRADFELPPLELTGAESTTLGLAARVWQEAALDEATSRALAKLKAAGVTVAADRLTATVPKLPTRELAFAPLWQGWLRRIPVRFRYHGRSRVVEPWKLMLRQGRWYVLGRDRTVGQARWFKLSRIEGEPQLVRGEPPFATVGADELADQVRRLEGPEPAQQAVLALRPEAASGLRRRGQAVPGSAPPGYERFSVPYSRDDEMAAEAGAAGADVLVLAPAELRAQVVERLRGWASRVSETPAVAQPRAEAELDGDAVGLSPQDEARPEDQAGSSAADGLVDLGFGPDRPGGGPGDPVDGLPQPSRPGAVDPDSPDSAADQVARLLLLIPYLRSHPGVRLAEVSEIFGLTAEQVRNDLAVAFLCGLPGGLPGDLIEVDLDLVDDEGVVYLTNADVLSRPLRLTPDEAMGLTVALQAVRQVAAQPAYPVIDSLLAKLTALSPARPDTPAVSLAAGSAPIRQQLAQAISQTEQVELAYDGLARGHVSHPVVDPARLVTVDGVAYLSAWSQERQAWRSYRLDRISAVRPTGQPGQLHEVPPDPETWRARLAQAPTARLVVRPPGRWIAEYYPVTEHKLLANGDMELILPVVDPGWLRWLLLRLGPDVVSVDQPVAAAQAALAAQQALAAYTAAGLE